MAVPSSQAVSAVKVLKTNFCSTAAISMGSLDGSAMSVAELDDMMGVKNKA